MERGRGGGGLDKNAGRSETTSVRIYPPAFIPVARQKVDDTKSMAERRKRRGRTNARGKGGGSPEQRSVVRKGNDGGERGREGYPDKNVRTEEKESRSPSGLADPTAKR